MKRAISRLRTMPKFQQVAVVVSILLSGALSWTLVIKDAQHDTGVTAAGCSIDEILVKSCRPWVGATAGGYPQVAGDSNTQLNFLNTRINNANVLSNASLPVAINKKIDIGHIYHPQGTNLFSSAAKAVLNNSAISQAFINWKPLPDGFKWRDAGGGNATVNNYIKQGADAVKALGSRKIFLAIWHEPENDVSAGNCTSNASGASMGSPAEYVAMWRNVRAIFNQQGVSNAVWAMNYMGYQKWDCLVPLLWPGNSYVDWIVFDQYASGDESFQQSISHFYDYLGANSTANNNYISKPWGLAEHGYGQNTKSTDEKARQYWVQGKAAIEANTFPRIKMWLVFDTSTNGTMRVGYTFGGQVDIAEQNAFNGFVNAILAKETSTPTSPPPSPPPAADTTPPNIAFAAPAANATVSKVLTVSANANDNTGVVQVKLYVGSTLIKDDKDSSDGWASQWNSWNVADGAHELKAIAFDAAGNTQTATRQITVKNNAGTSNTPAPAPPTISSFTANPTEVAANSISVLSWSTNGVVAGGCNLAPSPLSTTSGNGQWTTPVLTSSASYTLTCKNSAGTIVSKSLSVIVAGQPAPPPPAAVAPANIPAAANDPVVRATTGQPVVNAELDSAIRQGELTALDVSVVTDEAKIAAISKVEYYTGGRLIQAVTSAPYALDTNLLGPGTYDVTQKTFFEDGSVAEKTQTITIESGTNVSPQVQWPAIVAGGTAIIGMLGGIGYLVWRIIRMRIAMGG